MKLKEEELKLIKERIKKDNKQLLFRLNTKLLNVKTKEIISLDDIYRINIKRKSSHLQNKMNVLFNYFDQFDMCFFTMTEPASIHSLNKSKDINEKIKQVRQSKKKFNSFNRFLLKDRFFKNVAVSEKFSIRASELHKDLTLHEHETFSIVKEKFGSFINLLYKKYSSFNKDKENFNRLGRMEVVVDSKYKNFLSDVSFKQIKIKINNKRTKIYVHKKDLKLIKTGNFFYFKFLDNYDTIQKEQMFKYVMKYVLKSDLSSDFSDISKLHRAIFLKSKVRRLIFSRFLFPSYIFNSFKGNGLLVFEKYSLEELTKMNHSNNFNRTFKYRIKTDFKNLHSIFHEDEKLIKTIKNFIKVKLSLNFTEVNTIMSRNNLDLLNDLNFSFKGYKGIYSNFLVRELKSIEIEGVVYKKKVSTLININEKEKEEINFQNISSRAFMSSLLISAKNKKINKIKKYITSNYNSLKFFSFNNDYNKENKLFNIKNFSSFI